MGGSTDDYLNHLTLSAYPLIPYKHMCPIYYVHMGEKWELAVPNKINNTMQIIYFRMYAIQIIIYFVHIENYTSYQSHITNILQILKIKR